MVTDDRVRTNRGPDNFVREGFPVARHQDDQGQGTQVAVGS